MEKTYEKKDNLTLKEIRTVEAPPVPAPIEQNYDVDYLKNNELDLKKKKLSIIEGALAAIASVDTEIEENQFRIDKCAEFGIKSKSESIDDEIADKEEELNNQ